MNKKEIISKVKFRLLQKYTAKNLLPSEEIINDCIDNTLKAINYTHSCTELPNIYEKEFNSERIKIINTLSDNYNVDKSTVRSLFCDGADWYKQKLTK